MLMKNFIVITLMLTAISFALSGQNAEKKWAIGLHGGTNEHRGELGSDFLKSPFYANGGISLGRYICPSFNVGLQGTLGEMGLWADNYNNYLTKKLDAALMFSYKFNNGYIIKEDAMFAPYLTLGAGLAHYSDSRGFGSTGNDFIVPLGFGLKVNITDWAAVQYQFLYNFTNHDDRDVLAVTQDKGNDGYFLQTVGVVFSFGKAKDSDKDGVSDKMDKCHETPANVQVDLSGCPLDGDGDGIADYLDKCPKIIGVKNLDGCPDADGDGITDAEDACPDQKGISQFKGCPDTDGDGIPDKDDNCPKEKGIAQFNGCPDTDGDGIMDKEDQCPKDKGVKNLNGCPDRDNDGIADKNDKCPDVAGIAANKGCPEVKEETKKVFEQALTGIQFETGSDVIKKSSFPILDQEIGRAHV